MAGDTEWNIDLEVNLFHAMRGHKPAGVNKHFHMIAIHEKFSSSAKKISSEDIWKHLATLYDLQALNESEIIPFPNRSGDFTLTDKDILELCQKSFPRSSYITSAPTEAPKSDGSSKNTVKPVKTETKSTFQTPKTEVKSESKLSSLGKPDSRSSTPSSRSTDQKSTSLNSSAKASQSSNSANTPMPSPNRRQRKRNANLSGASPATPTEANVKRRR